MKGRVELALENNNHSVFKMKYKLYLTTKKLNPIITSDISERLKEMFENISGNYNIYISQWDCQSDRIEILFESHPNTDHKKFINAYKSAASRLIKKEFPQIVDKLYNGQFWSNTFCLVTLDNEIDEEEINTYLEKKS